MTAASDRLSDPSRRGAVPQPSYNPVPIALPVVTTSPVVEIGRKFPWLTRLPRAIRVLDNPGAVYLRLALGGTPTLRFASGLVYPLVSRRDPVGRELLDLAYEGALLATAPDPDHLSWGVDPEAGLLTTPQGIRLRLDSIEAIVAAETFLYDLHFAGFDLSGRTVVDAGANIGDSSLYFASLGARVLAFEPDPANFAKLGRNLSLNPALAARIEAFPEAVGVDGEVDFRAGLRGDSGIHARGGTPVRVRSVSLRTILERAGLARAFLLKCDVKGAEAEIVRQPELGRFDRLAIEYCIAERGPPLSALQAAVRSAGFARIRVFKHNAFPFHLRDEGLLSAAREPGPGP